MNQPWIQKSDEFFNNQELMARAILRYEEHLGRFDNVCRKLIRTEKDKMEIMKENEMLREQIGVLTNRLEDLKEAQNLGKKSQGPGMIEGIW